MENEEQTSGQQVTTPAQQSGSENWEARYKGSVPKIEQLTIQVRDLTAQLAAKSSEYEQLKSQLSIKDVEKDVAVSEMTKQYEEIFKAKTQNETELTQLRSLKAKVDTAKKLGRPELMEIVDRIPDVGDPVALEEIMKSFVDWGEKLVKQRESQILAGYTPPVGNVTGGETLPSTAEGWQKYVNKFEAGSPEKQKAMDQWRTWGMASTNS